MRSLTSTAATCVLLLAAADADLYAGEARLYLAPYAFSSSLTGEARASGGLGGTDFDLEDTLGIEPDETILGLDGWVKLGGGRIEFAYGAGRYEGEERLGSTLEFNGTSFAAGEKLDAEVDFTRYKLMFGYDFNLRIVNIGFVVGGHLVDLDSSVRSQSGVSEEEDLRAPIPVIGLTLGVHPHPRLSFHAEASGMSVTISDIETTLIDGFVAVDYYFVPRFGATAGYRLFTLEATDEEDDDHVDLRQRGPYAGLVLHL